MTDFFEDEIRDRDTRLPLLAISALLAVTLWPLTAAAQGWMHWPVGRAESSAAYITQGFYGDYISYCCSSGTNCRNGCGTHNGYDYGIVVGTSLYAVAPGVVDDVHTTDTNSTAYGQAGKWVRVRHDEATLPGLGATYYVAYLHMNSIAVSPGDAVSTETVLGTSGNTGGVAAHLHLHLATDKRFCSAPVDPGCPTPDYVEGSVIPGFSGGSACEQKCEAVPILWKSPAAYGGEPYEDLCDGLDFIGRCDGDLLQWCEGGRPEEVDCTETGRACGDNGPDIGFDCLTCEELAEPRCEGDRWIECDGEGTRSTDCAASGATCQPGTGCVGVTADMGAGADAGADVGADASMQDSGEPRDGGMSPMPDLGSPAPDAGGRSDLHDGSDIVTASGCACSSARRKPPGPWILAALLGLAIGRRRSRRSTTS